MRVIRQDHTENIFQNIFCRSVIYSQNTDVKPNRLKNMVKPCVGANPNYESALKCTAKRVLRPEQPNRLANIPNNLSFQLTKNSKNRKFI